MRFSTITVVACALAVAGLAAPAPQQSVVRIGHDRDGPASSVSSSDELPSISEDETSHEETSVEETDSDEPESESESETKETETDDGELGSVSDDEPSRSTVFVDGSTKIVSESGSDESESSSSSRVAASLALVGASVLLAAF
ncbi:hypothetical protein GGH96_000446 [Coemansia sp. RSA 1972]|nr:hypothetical protein GGH96_000446 [Coemansia sp. RSA 1972]